ncbi:MAG: hypothetical protein ACRCX2_03405 [Paraclostridium sp.]
MPILLLGIFILPLIFIYLYNFLILILIVFLTLKFTTEIINNIIKIFKK